MGLFVAKYGGTSLDTPDKIEAIARRSAACREEGHDLVIVVSAMGATTDALLQQAARFSRAPEPRALGLLLATGEIAASAILALAIGQTGARAIALTGGQCGIRTDGSYDNARIVRIETGRVRRHLAAGTIVVVAGFQGESGGEINLLGRGGSDVTAVALASALNADGCSICSDVAGVYSADPRLVARASLLTRVSYEDMIELAGCGARVLMGRAVEVAREHDMRLAVQSWRDEAPGTIIGGEEDGMEEVRITGIATRNDLTLVTVTSDPEQPPDHVVDTLMNLGAATALLSGCALDGRVQWRYLVEGVDHQDIAAGLLDCQAAGRFGSYALDGPVAQIAIVGHRISETPAVVQTGIRALSEAAVPILYLTTSASRITLLVPGAELSRAANCLHNNLGLAQDRQPLEARIG